MELSATITVPKLGEFLLGSASRAHNRLVKAAARGEAEHHHQARVPGHFTRAAHSKYGYADRSLRYIKRKSRRYGHQLDLVQTGASQKQICEQANVSVGGSGDRVSAKIGMRFAWAQRVAEANQRRYDPRRLARPPRPRVAPKVTIEQMKREVRAITGEELTEISHGIRRRYVEGVVMTTGSRQQVKV